MFLHGEVGMAGHLSLLEGLQYSMLDIILQGNTSGARYLAVLGRAALHCYQVLALLDSGSDSQCDLSQYFPDGGHA